MTSAGRVPPAFRESSFLTCVVAPLLFQQQLQPSPPLPAGTERRKQSLVLFCIIFKMLICVLCV